MWLVLNIFAVRRIPSLNSIVSYKILSSAAEAAVDSETDSG